MNGLLEQPKPRSLGELAQAHLGRDEEPERKPKKTKAKKSNCKHEWRERKNAPTWFYCIHCLAHCQINFQNEIGVITSVNLKDKKAPEEKS